MHTQDKLKLAGAGATVLLVASVATHVHRKKSNRQAAEFFSQLERQLNPSTGLAQNPGFDIKYWQNIGGKLKKRVVRTSREVAIRDAETIYKAWGFFNDDEDAIYGVLRAQKDLVQLSYMAYWYNLKYKVNLIDSLRSGFTPEEIGEVMKIADSLPPYRLAK